MQNRAREKVAIIGVECLFPGATNAQNFWRNICDGKDCISEIPASHWLIKDYYDPDPEKAGKTYAKKGGFISEVAFDPVEFGIPPNSIATIDTEQLLTLQVAKKLLANIASVKQKKVDKQNISVILGSSCGTEMLAAMAAKIQQPHWSKVLQEHGIDAEKAQQICADISATYAEWTENTFPGLLQNVTAGRIANRFNFGGLNCVVDAACASSLGAIAMAVQELQLGNSDLIITGGVDAFNDIFTYLCFSKTPALSPTHDCRPFSAQADGTIIGEGVCLFALRRLPEAEKDSDKIFAVIRGIGASSDGLAKSIYAPRAEGQALAIKRAYKQAKVSPTEIGLIEAHGTGTAVGDKVEFTGLQQAFGTLAAKQFCALGSVKSQIGHTKGAAGSASLVKTMMALHHKVLPTTIKIAQPNAQLNLSDSAFYLNTQTRPWIHEEKTTRKAAVSAFGFGGSNFHLVLEEYKKTQPHPQRFPNTSAAALILISAANVMELQKKIESLIAALPKTNLAILARQTQCQFRARAKMRGALLIKNSEIDLAREALQKIASHPEQQLIVPNQVYYEPNTIKRGKIALLFPGQGAQYINMGADIIMEFDEARKPWDTIAGIDAKEIHKLIKVVFPIPALTQQERQRQVDELIQTQWAQPAIGLTSLAYLSLLTKLGIDADCMAGHSYGELGALFAAGVIPSLESFVDISRVRGELLARAAQAQGAMTAVWAPLVDVEHYLKKYNINISIANINSPQQVVCAGRLEEIEDFEQKLKMLTIKFSRLPVATAFHTDLVAASAQTFYQVLQSTKLSSASKPVYSNTTGELYGTKLANIRKTLAWQLANPVLFAQQLATMSAAGVKVFIELGPGSVLTKLVKQCLPNREHYAISLDRGESHNGLDAFWHALAQLAVLGIPLKFAQLWQNFAPGKEEVEPSSATTIKIRGCNYGKPYPTLIKDHKTIKQSKDTNKNNIWHQALQETVEAQKMFVQSHMSFLKSAFQFLTDAAEGDNLEELAQLSELNPPNMQAMAKEIATKLPQGSTSSAANIQEFVEEPPKAAKPQAAPMQDDAVVNNLTPKTSDTFNQTLLKIVAEKTGYPQEMLSMDMQLEADLGIDSIKKVEIFSAIEDHFPHLPNINTEELTSLNTLAEILQVIKQENGKIATEPTTTKQFSQLLLQIVAEKTGYPQEMLSMDMQLEADLGIDSIKKVEIFSAIEDHFPHLPNISTEELTSLTTLRMIVDTYCTQKDKPINLSEYKYYINMNVAAPSGIAVAGLYAADPLYIIRDNRGVAEILANKLQAINIKVKITAEIPRECHGILYLKGLNSLDQKDSVTAALNLNIAAFKTAHLIGKQFFVQGGVFIIAYDASSARSWLAGLSALAKTAAQEWPKANLKAIDVASSQRKPEAIATAIFTEIVFGGPESYVKLDSSNERYCYSMGKAPTGDGFSLPIVEDSVVVVSGGARGITSSCLLALAEKVKLKFAILGRTLLTPEPYYVADCNTAQDLKTAILENYKNANKTLTPGELTAQVKHVLALREVRANIKKLEEKGAKVEYFSADIADPNAVQTILQKIRKEWGEIQVLIHAAGVLDDKYIHDKTAKQFAKVFNTKVLGLKNLLAATQADKLTHICCFSSIVACLGNRGQVDYAMANEIMNKVCHRESISRKNQTVIKTINWGPWEGGMVTPELKQHFQALGVGLLPVTIGAKIFGEEILSANTPHTELIVGNNLTNFIYNADKTTNWNIFVDNLHYPFLKSHVIQNIPVMPMMMAFELCLRVVRSLYPDKASIVTKDLKVLKGIKIAHFATQGLWLNIKSFTKMVEDNIYVDLNIESMDGQKHYVMTMLGNNKTVSSPVFKNTLGSLSPWRVSKTTIYRNMLFHGKDFQVIRKLEGISARGCSGILKTGVSLNKEERMWGADVAILDGGLQLAGLWVQAQTGYDALPTGIGSLRVYKYSIYKTPIHCQLILKEKHKFQTIWDLTYYDDKEEVVAAITALVMQNNINPKFFNKEEL